MLEVKKPSVAVGILDTGLFSVVHKIQPTGRTLLPAFNIVHIGWAKSRYRYIGILYTVYLLSAHFIYHILLLLLLWSITTS